jgi:hypothetical protein
MTKGGKTRHGKLVTAGHSTRVEGFDNFCKDVLDKWPEVTQIRVGTLGRRNVVGRKSKRPKATIVGESRSGNVIISRPTTQGHKRAQGGGGFSFRATRWAMIGTRITGIKCDAKNGSVTQEVVLYGEDLTALKHRLNREGYGATW